jgi:predicted acyltransferase
MSMSTASSTAEAVRPGGSGRVVSIDALRGFDMFWLIRGYGVIMAAAALISPQLGSAVAVQMDHSKWTGFTFWDFIAPLFLFVVGLSMPYSISRRLERGDSRRDLYRHIVRRTVILILLGWLMSGWLALDFPLRIAGVLERIALSYFIAALIVMRCGIRGQILWTAGLLLGYWAAMAWIPVPGFGAGVYTMQGNLSGYLDRLLLPSASRWCCADYAKYGDFSGLLGTFPSAATVMPGVLCGHLLRSSVPAAKKLLVFWGGGAAAVGLGLLWNMVHPIVTALWTSSYVMYATGWSMMLYGLFYWIIDVRGYRKWAFPFVVIGMNALTIYVLQSQVKFGDFANIVMRGVIKRSGSYATLLTFASTLAVEWLFLYWLYRKKLFWKV